MTDSVRKLGDPYAKTPITIGSIPPGPTGIHRASATVAAGTATTFNVLVEPQYPYLTLWNIPVSIFLDAEDDNHIFPSGSSVLPISNKVTVSAWMDVYLSRPVMGTRAMVIHVVNNHTSSHEVILYVKAYLQTGLTSSDIT